MNFSELGLNPSIVKVLQEQGYEQPTPVQLQAIPAALAGGDLLVSSQTGSGKTAAFMLPSLERLTSPSPVQANGPRILVLTPTRELAQQVKTAAETYSRNLRRVRTVCVVGGTAYPQQLRSMKAPYEVLVATPGRLLDLATSRRVDFSRLEVLVLDEADRMLDMGFIDDIETIASMTPSSRQTLLFSATLDGVVGKLAEGVTRQATRIEIAPVEKNKPKIAQKLMYADDFGHKNRLLDALLRDTSIEQAVVFTSTKRSADDLADNLSAQGFSTRALHGDMSQRERNRTLTELRRGQVKVLVATDVAARGIDVPGISHVINFDLPRQVEDYVHRIGRTGRAGREGIAISLAAHGEVRQVRNIERFTTQMIPETTLPGLEPSSRPRNKSAGGPRGRNGERSAGGRGFGNPNGNRNGSFREGSQRSAQEPRSFGGNRGSFGDQPRSFTEQPRSFGNTSGGDQTREGQRGDRNSRGFQERQPAWNQEQRKPGFGGNRHSAFSENGRTGSKDSQRFTTGHEGRSFGKSHGSGAPRGRSGFDNA